MFWSKKNKKNRLTSAYPSFAVYKWGSMGYTCLGHEILMMSFFHILIMTMFQFSARESAGQTKSWSEMADEEAEARTPGHAVHMHEKLSSPSRKR